MENKEKYIKAFKKGVKNSDTLSDPGQWLPIVYPRCKSGDIELYSISLGSDYGFTYRNKLEISFSDDKVSFVKKIELTEKESRNLLDFYAKKFRVIDEIKKQNQKELESNLDGIVDKYLEKK